MMDMYMYDADGSGGLDQIEFVSAICANGLTAANIQSLFNAFDSNGDEQARCRISTRTWASGGPFLLGRLLRGVRSDDESITVVCRTSTLMEKSVHVLGFRLSY